MGPLEIAILLGMLMLAIMLAIRAIWRGVGANIWVSISVLPPDVSREQPKTTVTIVGEIKNARTTVITGTLYDADIGLDDPLETFALAFNKSKRATTSVTLRLDSWERLRGTAGHGGAEEEWMIYAVTDARPDLKIDSKESNKVWVHLDEG